MPVCGTVVLPSPDTETPDVPVSAHVPLTPSDFGIPPQSGPFTPKEIAGHLRVTSQEIIGLIESGQMRALAVHRGQRTTYRIPYTEVSMFFLRQQRN